MAQTLQSHTWRDLAGAAVRWDCLVHGAAEPSPAGHCLPHDWSRWGLPSPLPCHLSTLRQICQDWTQMAITVWHHMHPSLCCFLHIITSTLPLFSNGKMHHMQTTLPAQCWLTCRQQVRLPWHFAARGVLQDKRNQNSSQRLQAPHLCRWRLHRHRLPHLHDARHCLHSHA